MPYTQLKSCSQPRSRTAETIAANAPIAVRQAKLAIGRGGGMGVSDGLAMEIEAYNRTIPTEDRREGVAAFNEKTPARVSRRMTRG